MKQAARRRLKREVIKRARYNKREKASRINSFIRASSLEEFTEIRLYGYHAKKYSTSISRCRNHCLVSGRAHSIYSHYRLSRNEMRRFAHKGLLFGLKKAGW